MQSSRQNGLGALTSIVDVGSDPQEATSAMKMPAKLELPHPDMTPKEACRTVQDYEEVCRAPQLISAEENDDEYSAGTALCAIQPEPRPRARRRGGGEVPTSFE